MKISNVTKILIQLKRLFTSYITENGGILMSYKLQIEDKKLILDFALNMSTYIENQELINNFIKKYNFELYIKIINCQHIMQNNYMRSIFTFEITDKAATQENELCGLLMIK